MGLSRRINLRLEAEQHAAVVAYGHRHGLRPSPAARHLISEAMQTVTPGGNEQPAAALAALVAAEHAVLMVASVLPEGESRMHALAARASEAAEERLAMFVEPAALGDGE
jgi:hypothetical protein